MTGTVRLRAGEGVVEWRPETARVLPQSGRLVPRPQFEIVGELSPAEAAELTPGVVELTPDEVMGSVYLPICCLVRSAGVGPSHPVAEGGRARTDGDRDPYAVPRESALPAATGYF